MCRFRLDVAGIVRILNAGVKSKLEKIQHSEQISCSCHTQGEGVAGSHHRRRTQSTFEAHTAKGGVCRAVRGKAAQPPRVARHGAMRVAVCQGVARGGLSSPSRGRSRRQGARKSQAPTQTAARLRFFVSTSPRVAPRKRGYGFANPVVSPHRVFLNDCCACAQFRRRCAHEQELCHGSNCCPW